jgi:hypothetical protein
MRKPWLWNGEDGALAKACALPVPYPTMAFGTRPWTSVRR